MRVKRLEIQGFKSFKDKTVIHFDHGITGIVGPNGCGKSNIVDAFFWVMGEQSYKHMRGSGSDDLIFNGSSKYSPLGLAEATMVLETDAVDTENAPAGASAADLPLHLKTKEISVTRRLYRGGEGEYFVNGVPARLKDIQELFMDTGVGAKGYSVIEQGQIGKIVNAKPEDRRLLVEEAAGIAKYKARKKESLRKMEATQANLSRLNDVISEIERTLGSLERQAQKARQYKKYKEELLDKEMTWGRRKIQVLRQKLEAFRVQKVALEQELVGLRAELQVAENSIETDRIEQLTDTKAAETLQARIQQLSDELTRERSALELSKRRQNDLNTQLETLEHEKADLQANIALEQEKLREREDQAAEASAQYETAAFNAQERDENVRRLRQETEAARRAHEQNKRELMSGISRASDLTSKGASLASRIESAESQVLRLTQQLEIQGAKVENSREEAEKTRVSAEEIRARRETLREELQAETARAKEQEQKLRALERERDDSNRQLTQLRSKLESLEELAAAREGFGDASKAALDWARENGHEESLVALADVLDVTPGYESAMEGWLETRLEHLISETAALAVETMERVRENRNGRVAVHVDENPGTWIQSAATADEVLSLLRTNDFEVLGKLSDFVTVNSKLLGLDYAARTIGNVIVVRSFGPMSGFISKGLARKLDGWSVLSMEGDALDADGTLRGGSKETEGTASLLRRKRAIHDLQAQVAAAATAHEARVAAADEARHALEEMKTRSQGLQTEVQGLEIQAAALDRDVHQMSRALKEAENQLLSLQRELAEFQEEAELARDERSRIEAELNSFISTRSDLEEKIAAGEADVNLRETEARSQESELQVLRVQEASLRERASSLKRELEAGRALIADRERRLSEVNRALDRASSEQQQFTGSESSTEQKIEELTISLAAVREELAVVKDRIERSSAKVNSALERIKYLHHTGDAKTSDANQLALEFEKISSEIAHLTQNLEEKYGPGCLETPVTSPIQEEMSEPVITAEMSAEEELQLGEEVERLRERIRRLGDVNPEAIEQFEEQKKRYDYLATEKSDLERSIDNLQEAIEHINKTSEERFRKAFEAIADRFERLFPIIFGGGQARLSLVYPEGSTDILEAGVDILAQPPGKKVVNIGLLSGGEKALTAVSLIFAIFMVKPSPFCVLDEVDAPLDDANIGKFNALLREMSAKSQFILITHNKKTMELNDTLYGVTMEEPGVSKMVSIELQ
ncbi:MAG: chromosome segregation protein SMC [Oligoflexia bacterium]|nr:chromosome segregation protein SMC [Oligoflexia bacterium]